MDGGLKGVARKSSWSSGLHLSGVLPERRPELFEIDAEEADIAAHDAQVGNLFARNPQIERLRAYTEKAGCLPDIPRAVVC